MEGFIQKVFFGLFFVLNPLIIVPIYLGMTASYSERERKIIALKACVFAFFLCCAATIFGKMMLDAVGISNDALRIAGGLLLLYVGFHMIIDEIKDSSQNQDTSRDVAIVPLGFPIITGPGTLTLAMSYIADAPHPEDWIYRFIVIGVAGAIIVSVFIGCLFSTLIFRLLGQNGIVVIQRIVGLLIVAFSIQMIIAGINGSFAKTASIGSMHMPFCEIHSTYCKG